MISRRIKIMMILAAILLLVILVCILFTMLYQKSVLEKERELLKENVRELWEQYETMKDNKEYMETVTYLEERARELGLIKEGEILWVLVDE